MRIGIFGGSFDPVHTEHVELAKGAIRDLKLNKLVVMPAHTPPHKRGKTLSSDNARLEMCRIAFDNIDGVEVSDYEMQQGGTSYTYLTCRYFKEIYPSAELFWLVGTDMLRDFPTWKNPEEILNTVTLAVCARAENVGWEQIERERFRKRFGKDFTIISYAGKAVSSTLVRVLAGAGEDVTPYVGERVASYIKSKKLYEIPFAKDALALEKESRKAHSLSVACFVAAHASKFGVDEKKAITAALFHDCAKNLPNDSPFLAGFTSDKAVPDPVVHQYAGAYVAEKFFGVSDEDTLNAIRYHTSGRAGMSNLEKLVYLADMLEDGRAFEGVQTLREIFREQGLDACLSAALKGTLEYLEREGNAVYSLTRTAYEYYKNAKGE